jgi:tetratricopeptide (TPR) repeat protein
VKHRVLSPATERSPSRGTWILTFSIASLALVSCGGGPDTAPIESAASTASGAAKEIEASLESYFDLGDFQRKVSTTNEDAQAWFDRGLVLCYGFNHAEAMRCFQRAEKADPSCAMVHWGKAYAIGPNINNMAMDEAGCKLAWESLQQAIQLKDAAFPVEQDLIDALATRYALPAPEDRSALNVAYSNAMREVAQRHTDDGDVVALFAESMMILRPWNHWSKEGEAAPETPEIVATLEAGLARWPRHPALCHFYIHTMEASPDPGKALAAADVLRDLIPQSGHLVHMPSHIDIQLGRYPQAIQANQKGIRADLLYARKAGRKNFYTAYRAHNYHFLTYAAMFDGQSARAMQAARELVKEVPEDFLLEMADFLDFFIATPLHVMVRFGQWDAILSEPEPRTELFMTRAIWHYARCVALAATGKVEEAEADRLKLEAVAKEMPATRIAFNNSCHDVLVVARAMAKGEVEYRRGNFDRAFHVLRQAVEFDDALNYDEPWGWMQPARHALGALLLEQGNVDEAWQVYRKDLQRHPRNGWALHGLAECLRRQGKEEEAKGVEERLKSAWGRADVELKGSCFCRLGAPS